MGGGGGGQRRWDWGVGEGLCYELIQPIKCIRGYIDLGVFC